jgi:hypothetical protein
MCKHFCKKIALYFFLVTSFGKQHCYELSLRVMMTQDARPACPGTAGATKATLPANHFPLTLSPPEVKAALSRTNKRKAAGPDGIPGRVLKTCAEQLTGVLTSIFNLSLAQAKVPACFKST